MTEVKVEVNVVHAVGNDLEDNRDVTLQHKGHQAEVGSNGMLAGPLGGLLVQFTDG